MTTSRRLGSALGGRVARADGLHLFFRWAWELATHPRLLDCMEDLLGPNHHPQAHQDLLQVWQECGLGGLAPGRLHGASDRWPGTGDLARAHGGHGRERLSARGAALAPHGHAVALFA